MRVRDIRAYDKRDRKNYRTIEHKTVVFERLPSLAGAQFVNKLSNSIKKCPYANGILNSPERNIDRNL